MSRFISVLSGLVLLTACTSAVNASPDFPAEAWLDAEIDSAEYLLAPGDTLDIIVYSAPELSRTVQIAPDGNIRMPLTGPVKAAARTVTDVRTALRGELASELLEPDLDVIATDFATQNIFVGGEVKRAGMVELPGQIDPLQATIMAGGFTDRADPSQVLLMRRLPSGDLRTRLVNIGDGLTDPAAATWGPLRRFDVVYVPKSPIANQNLFVRQYIRDALPLDFLLFYELGGD